MEQGYLLKRLMNQKEKQELEYFCKDRWALLYVKRWMQVGVMQKDGINIDRMSGTPQGGVISSLLANN